MGKQETEVWKDHVWILAKEVMVLSLLAMQPCRRRKSTALEANEPQTEAEELELELEVACLAKDAMNSKGMHS
jgi:hypothetical protein